jgi:NitT/TauT family transport system substrate-binding protein
MQMLQNRRRFIAGLSAASAAGLVLTPRSIHAEPRPETTAVRLPQWLDDAFCWAPAYMAGELLRTEGFTDVRYVQGKNGADNSHWLIDGETDFDINMASMHIKSIDAGVPIKVLTGLHSGCFELISNDSVQTITDLKGKKVGLWSLGSHPHLLVELMVNYVGLDPTTDIEWVAASDVSPTDLFIEGKIDAILSAAPEPQELRAKKIGHTVVDNGSDRPWSQYFCCMIAGNAEYVSKYPIATKRILRAILKSADLCASDPQLVARQLVERGFATRPEPVIQTLSAVNYETWREYDPEDSMRFYALRMQETGMIKSSPQKIIADGTDWRFHDELRRELKG